MKNELGGKMAQFVGFRANSFYYVKDDGSEDNKAKDPTKIICHKKLKTIQKQFNLKIK